MDEANTNATDCRLDIHEPKTMIISNEKIIATMNITVNGKLLEHVMIFFLTHILYI